MKKILSILVVGLCFFTTGCVNTNTSITIDKNDNAVIENKILIDQSVLNYGNTQVEELFSGKDDITRDIIKPDDKNLKTEKEKIEEGGYVGYKYTTTVHKLRKVDISPVVGLLEPKNGQLFEVKDKFFSRHYVLNAEVKANENESNTPSNFDIKAEDLIKSKFSVTIPTKPISHNADTITEENQLFWDIGPSKSGNPITLEFSVIKWHSIILTCILGILLIIGILVIILKPTILNLIKDSFSNVVERLKKRTETEDNIEQNTESKATEEQEENDNNTKIGTTNKSKLYLTLGSIIGFVLIASLAFFFSTPKISEYLITKSIENVSSGKPEEAIKLIKFANRLNNNKNSDLAKEMFSKSIEEFDKENITIAESFMEISMQLNTDNSEEFAKELVEKGIENLNKKKYDTATKLMEYAIKYNEEIPQNKLDDLRKKWSGLLLERKYDEALAYIDICILLNPKDEKSYAGKGLTLQRLNKNTEALEFYTKAINLNDNYTGVYIQRGNFYLSMKEYDKALADFDQVVKKSLDKQQVAEAKYNKAKIYIKKKDYRAAMDNAWSAKELYGDSGNSKKMEESYILFDHAAQLECDRPNGYCY